MLQDTQDPRNNCKIYNTGNILNSIIPVLYQSTVTYMHSFRLYYSTTYNAIPKVSTLKVGHLKFTHFKWNGDRFMVTDFKVTDFKVTDLKLKAYR